jgi:Ca2+-binding RTX toxin-like protein
MRPTVLPVLLLALLAATLVPAASPAEAAGFTCLGKKATIVGDLQDMYHIDGTKKDDVIVSNGATSVGGGAGDDLICITRDSASVSDGPGDDTVVVQLTTSHSPLQQTSLGSGKNTYIGSRGPELVTLYEGVNDVRTGGGNDTVDLEQRPGPRGTVDLGPGDDEVRVGRHSGGVLVDGGSGHNSFDFGDAAFKGERWTFDARAGVAKVDGRTIARWRHITRYQLRYLNGATRVRFTGTEAAESVYLREFGDFHRKVRADLGGGDDKLWIGGTYRGRVHLGTGHDDLTIAVGSEAQVDLGAQAAHVVDLTGRRNVFRLTGVENALTTFVETVDLVGGSGDNVLSANAACTATLSGLGGDDRLDVTTDERQAPDDCDPPIGFYWNTLDGGAGDDRLVGGYLEDLLRGGRGHDSADGAGAQDLCQAEKVTRC